MSRRPLALLLAFVGIAAPFASCGGGSAGDSSPGGAGPGGGSGAKAGEGGAASLGGAGGVEAGTAGAAGGGNAGSGGGGASGGTPGGAGAAAGHGGSPGHAGGAGAAGMPGHGGTSIGGASGAGGTNGTPVWSTIPGFDPPCVVEIMSNLATFGPMFTWQACDIDLPGCQRLALADALTVEHPELALQLFSTPSGPALTVFTDSRTTASLPTYSGFATTDGTPIQIMRHQAQTGCRPAGSAISNGRVASSIYSNFSSPVVSRVLLGPDTPGAMLTVSPPYSASVDASPDDPGLAGGWMLLRWSAGAPLWVADWTTGADPIQVAGFDMVGSASFPVATPDRVLFSGVVSRWTIYTSNGKNKVSEWLADPDPAVHYKLPAWGDGTLFWWVGRNAKTPLGDDFDQVELWASVYDPDPKKLVPKVVIPAGFTTSGDISGVAGQGRYAFGLAGGFFHVIRASDGEHRSFTLPASHSYAAAIGIDSGFVYWNGNTDGSEQVSAAVYRVAIDSLAVSPLPLV